MGAEAAVVATEVEEGAVGVGTLVATGGEPEEFWGAGEGVGLGEGTVGGAGEVTVGTIDIGVGSEELWGVAEAGGGAGEEELEGGRRTEGLEEGEELGGIEELLGIEELGAVWGWGAGETEGGAEPGGAEPGGVFVAAG